jgi:hypothetical protein
MKGAHEDGVRATTMNRSELYGFLALTYIVMLPIRISSSASDDSSLAT